MFCRMFSIDQWTTLLRHFDGFKAKLRVSFYDNCWVHWSSPHAFSRPHLMSMSLHDLEEVWLLLMRSGQSVLDTLKKREKKPANAIRPMRAVERDFGWSNVKVSGCIYCDLMWRVWKEEKVKEIKGGGRSAIWRRVKREKSHQMRLRTKVLSSRTAWVKASKRERKTERRIENIQWKREQRVKREWNFFYFYFYLFKCISKCCNIYLIE